MLRFDLRAVDVERTEVQKSSLPNKNGGPKAYVPPVRPLPDARKSGSAIGARLCRALKEIKQFGAFFCHSGDARPEGDRRPIRIRVIMEPQNQRSCAPTRREDGRRARLLYRPLSPEDE